MNTVQPVVNAVAPIAANIPQLAPVVGAGRQGDSDCLEATDEADAMETTKVSRPSYLTLWNFLVELPMVEEKAHLLFFLESRIQQINSYKVV